MAILTYEEVYAASKHRNDQELFMSEGFYPGEFAGVVMLIIADLIAFAIVMKVIVG